MITRKGQQNRGPEVEAEAKNRDLHMLQNQEGQDLMLQKRTISHRIHAATLK